MLFRLAALIRRRPWSTLGLAALAGALGVTLLWTFWPPEWTRDVVWKAGEGALHWLQSKGMVPFYGAAAVAALAGAPISPFLLLGAAAFGTWPGFLGGMAAVAITVVVSHLLGRTVLRPFLQALLGERLRRLDGLKTSDHRSLTLILRITPGVPFAAQNYLLPLAGVPLGLNAVYSIPIQSVYMAGFVFLGGSIFSGQAGKAVLGVVLLVLVAVGVRWWSSRRAVRTGPAEVS